jgi:hypothetical protein
VKKIHLTSVTYEGRWKSSWTQLITPSRNFVEVRWRSLFRSTSLGKRCTFYNASPTLENVLQTIDHFEISCLRAPFSWLGKPRNCMGRYLDCMADVLVRFHRSIFSKPNKDPIQISPHAISRLFQPWKGSSEERNFKVINGLQHVFEKWVERCKKCIAFQGRYFKKETVTAPPQSSDSEQ